MIYTNVGSSNNDDGFDLSNVVEEDEEETAKPADDVGFMEAAGEMP